MKPNEQAQILELMEGGAVVFQDAVKSVEETFAKQRPEPQRWSALECAEHVAVAEAFLFSRVTAATPADAPVINQERESNILNYAADRSTRFEAPEPVRPTGRFSSLDEAVAQFLANRERTIRFIMGCDADLRAELTTHPRLGNVNGYEVLLLMAMHPRRHAAQIREVRAALTSARPASAG